MATKQAAKKAAAPAKKAPPVKNAAATKKAAPAKKATAAKTTAPAKAPAKAPPVKGPASYFPSIEAKYGKPVAHWFKLLDGQRDRKHMEQVDWLKSEHGIGHGHANALVAHHRAKGG